MAAHPTRLPQFEWAVGPPGGSSSSVPAGTMTCRRSRDGRGTGELQRVQIAVEKLLASGRSYREISSSPEIHRNCSGTTAMFVARTPPVAFLQREQ
jgi:hypothetical protein